MTEFWFTCTYVKVQKSVSRIYVWRSDWNVQTILENKKVQKFYNNIPGCSNDISDSEKKPIKNAWNRCEHQIYCVKKTANLLLQFCRMKSPPFIFILILKDTYIVLEKSLMYNKN
jgi:hypothetical protein